RYDLVTGVQTCALPICLKSKQDYAWKYNAPGDGVYVPAMLKELGDRADDRTIITCDVGQHQMWVAQHYGFRRPEHHLTSGGSGEIGRASCRERGRIARE